MKYIKLLSVFAIITFVSVTYYNIHAFFDGITGFTKKNGEMFGCGCHGLDPNDSTIVSILGPSSVETNDTALFVIQVSRLGMNAAGVNIAAQNGDLIAIDPFLQREAHPSNQWFELTHTSPKFDLLDTTIWIFAYIAPPAAGTDTIFANGNAVNHDTLSDGDYWNFAPNKVITVIGPSGIQNNNTAADNFNLHQNYPNPFNPVTKIKFSLLKSSVITLRIFDLSGKERAVLLNNQKMPGGDNDYVFDASAFNMNSGVYFYKLESDGFAQVKKMMLIK